MSLLAAIMLLSASCVFSEFSHETNTSQALCNAARLPVKILLLLEGGSVGGLSISVDGSFGFCPRASWKGENP